MADHFTTLRSKGLKNFSYCYIFRSRTIDLAVQKHFIYLYLRWFLYAAAFNLQKVTPIVFSNFSLNKWAVFLWIRQMSLFFTLQQWEIFCISKKCHEKWNSFIMSKVKSLFALFFYVFTQPNVKKIRVWKFVLFAWMRVL